MAELAKSCYVFPALLFLVSFGLEVLSANEDGTQSPSNIRYFLYQSTEYPRDCQEVVSQCSSDKVVSGVYLIRPVQYPEPFEVYCDNNVTLGGWTVIQRRNGGYINFNRSWNDFKFGFGFVGSEFWMGNEKLAHLTNQKRYELRIDLENTEGQSYYIAYDNFRIADEWDSYSLSSVGDSETSVPFPITWCVTNKQPESQSICERSCENPDQCVPPNPSEPERCICEGNYIAHDGSCIPKEQCGCYDQDNDVVVGEGESLLKSGCLMRITCSNNRLISDSYTCGDDATCEETGGVGRCICDEWFQGDGVTCTRNGPTDCYDLYMANRTIDMKYTIYPAGSSGFDVSCDMSNGGWTILQNRTSSSDFYRDWNGYKEGFENPNGDHWLGNDKIHILTNQKTYTLRIEKTDSVSSQYYSEYSNFQIGDEGQNYELLSLGVYSGTSGHNALAASQGAQFSTKNDDNDGSSTYDCAEKHRGGWWYPDDTSTGTTDHCFSFSTSAATGNYEYSDCRCYSNCYYYDGCGWCCCSNGSDCYCSGCYSGDCGCGYSYYKCSNCDGCSGSTPYRRCRNRNEIVETTYYSCGESNLNGDYQYNDYRGIFWRNLQGSACGITETTMKIRPT